MTTAEVLKAARARIEKGWCRDWYARDATGAQVDPRAANAVEWCLFGALLPDPEDNKLTDADRALIHASGDNDFLAEWNDEEERTRADVLDLYDRAIALAEQAADTSRDAAGIP